MMKQSIVAVVLAVIAASTMADTASAKGMSSGSKMSSGSSIKTSKPILVSKKVIIVKNEHRRRYYGGSYVVASYDSCRWLKVRALETGSPSWWARYEECRDGN